MHIDAAGYREPFSFSPYPALRWWDSIRVEGLLKPRVRWRLRPIGIGQSVGSVARESM